MQTNDAQILLDENLAQSSYELARQLEVDHSTVIRRLRAMGKVREEDLTMKNEIMYGFFLDEIGYSK